MKKNPIQAADLFARRPRCLAAGMILQLMIGMNYAFSVFQVPLVEKFNTSLSTVTLLSSLGGLLGMLLSLTVAPIMRSKLGTRKMAIIGGFLYGMAFFSAGFISKSILFLFPSLLLIRGLGGFMVDLPIKSYAVELYPDRSGWASGLTTAAFGAAAILWAPLVSALLTKVGDVSVTFLIVGGFFSIALVVVALGVFDVPSDYHKLFERNLTMQAPDQYYNVDRSRLVHLPIFYLFLIGLILAFSGGNAILNQCAYIMETLLGTSAETAALAVSAIALANMLGRIVCGTIADRIGKLNMTYISQIAGTVGLLGCTLFTSPIGFVVSAMVVIFFFGGLTCLLPPLSEEVFGHQHMAENYTIIFSIPTFSAMLGPTISSSLIDKSGSLTLSMLACTILSAAGMVMMWITRARLRRLSAQKTETH